MSESVVQEVETPVLDAIEMSMSIGSRQERLSDREYLLMEQLLAYPEQKLTGESLKDTIGQKPSAPDRIIVKEMAQLIQKANALFPAYPLVRRVSRNTWLYTEVPPKKKKRETGQTE